MLHSLIYKFTYILRSRIRFARYRRSIKNQVIKNHPLGLIQQNPHPVTLGPEQISRFFTYVANNERSRF